MPDIKLKPQMDKPKALEVIRAPKDANFMLKEQYEREQSQPTPSEKGPVQYATDNVETAGRRGAAMTAGSVRRSAKLYKEAVIKRKAQRQVQATQGGHEWSYYGTNTYKWAQATSETIRTPTVRERGRLKAIEDNKNCIKTRNLSEKGNAIMREFKDRPKLGTQTSDRVMQNTVSVKTGNAGTRSISDKDRFMTSSAFAAKKAKQEKSKKMQNQMLKQAVAKAKKNARVAANAAVNVTKAAARAVAVAIKGIFTAGGGAVLLATVLLAAIIAAVAASPFGIFFSGENTGPDAVPVSAAVAEINSDFNAQLEALQTGEYDDVVIRGAAADWPEVLAVFASKVAGADGSEAADVVTIDRDRIDKLKTVFWDMTSISSHVEVIPHGDSNPHDKVEDSWTRRILHITIAAKSAAEMPEFYGFTQRQTASMNELLAQRAMLVELVGNLSIISADTSAVLDNLPANLSSERNAVIRTACSLVGKVNYFWGGKSTVIGWDTRWGQVQKVWADGSSTTGTYRPYGMDCSGFVDWVFYNVTDGKYLIGHGGGAAKQHEHSTDIAWADAQPGDLVFYSGDGHVGIVGGKDESGNLIIIHCSSGYNNVAITDAEGFTSIARPE